MAVCFFNQDYNTSYDCVYVLKSDYLEVTIEYDISEEIELVNGMRSFGPDTTYDDRDILIVDQKARKSYLLKEAFYTRDKHVYHVDGGAYVTFKSYRFFSNSSAEKLSELPSNPKTKTIRIYSRMINSLLSQSSVKFDNQEEEIRVTMKKGHTGERIIINTNNIEGVIIGNEWTVMPGNEKIVIDIPGYVEINTRKKVSYKEITKYINEVIVFMQLYKPGRFMIDRICVKVDKDYYDLSIPCYSIQESKTNMPRSVQVDLKEFLAKCYTTIPYRNSRSYIRNIPYVVIKADRQWEDYFLIYYRLIESYWKSHSNNKSFIEHSINGWYKTKKLSDEEVERLTYEIISLRNHYVHSGYYIRNNSLKIKYPKVNGRANPKNYTKNNITLEWIVDLTLILKEVSLGIIFKEMLGYDEFEYKDY